MARGRIPAPDDRSGAALALAFLALAPVAVFAANGTVVVLALAALVLALARRQREAALRALSTPLSLTLVAFLLWAALSSAWAPDPSRSLTLAVRCALLFAAGLVCVTAAAGMSPSGRRLAARGLAVGGAAMLALLAVETASVGALTRFFRGMDVATLIEHTHGAPLARGATLLSLFCWPAFLAVGRLTDRRLAMLLFLPVPVVLGVQWTAASAAAIGVGMVAFALAYVRPRAALGLFFALFLTGIATPLLLPSVPADVPRLEARIEQLPLSWQHRVEIWRFAAETAAERPVIGWGFDAARALGRTVESDVLSRDRIALHPHNLALQVWLELGAVGVLLLATVGFLLVRGLWRMAEDRAAVAAALASTSGYLVYGQISRGAWQNWWLAAAWLLVAALLVAARLGPLRAEVAVRPPTRSE